MSVAEVDALTTQLASRLVANLMSAAQQPHTQAEGHQVRTVVPRPGPGPQVHVESATIADVRPTDIPRVEPRYGRTQLPIQRVLGYTPAGTGQDESVQYVRSTPQPREVDVMSNYSSQSGRSLLSRQDSLQSVPQERKSLRPSQEHQAVGQQPVSWPSQFTPVFESLAVQAVISALDDPDLPYSLAAALFTTPHFVQRCRRLAESVTLEVL